MLWKIYNIQSGQVIKSGLPNEDDARKWLEENREGMEDNYMPEEMDPDEVEEWRNKQSKGENDEVDLADEKDEEQEEEDFEKGRYSYKTEDDDYSNEDLNLGEVYEVDEDDEDDDDDDKEDEDKSDDA